MNVDGRYDTIPTKEVFTGVLVCRMQAGVVAGQIMFTSFHLHGSIGDQCDS